MLILPNLKKNPDRSDAALISRYHALLDILVRGGDIVLVLGAALLMNWIRFDTLHLENAYQNGIVRIALLTALIFPAFGLYKSWRGESLRHEIIRVWTAWVVVLALFMMLAWMFKSAGYYSRIWVVGVFLIAGVILAANRVTCRVILRLIRARGIDTRRVLLVGATATGERVVAAARTNMWMGLEVVGYVSTDFDHGRIDGLPCLGSMDDLQDLVSEHQPSEIWIALPLRAESVITQLLGAMAEVAVSVRLVPDMFGFELVKHKVSMVAGVPMITIRGSQVEGHARLFKAMEDRLLALLILLLISPLMIVLAIAVKCSSPGPVLYRQKRHGLGGVEIDIWKFRSMRVHVEQGGEITQAVRDDPRITRLGRLMRSTSLDELPQFINVVQGRMSIVGPRPHAIAHNLHFSSQLRGYMQRHGVKPGITGLAQISGYRGETDTLEKMKRRVERDIEYIQNWNVGLDLKIILLTPVAMLKRTNAY